VSDDWAAELETVLARGVTTLGPAAARETLERLLAGLDEQSDGVAPLVPRAPVLGVDGCPAGWVGVALDDDGTVTAHVASSIASLVESVRERVAIRVVAIDIPIGLPDADSRAADRLARKELGPRSSSVFTTPTRAAVYAGSWQEAKELNIAATAAGTSIAVQTWGIVPKIREVDQWLRTAPRLTVVETHPELAFTRLAGTPVLSRKTTPAGAAERRDLLGGAGLTAPHYYSGQGFSTDDLLDACAAAWTAARHAAGESESFPEEPEVFSDGLPASIRV
jgi:predicted RNase H-like nuclease